MNRYLIIITLLLLISCQKGDPDPKLKQAFDLHEMAVQKYDSLKLELNSLKAQTLTEEEAKKLKQLEETSSAWESSLVEVPGFEHDHEEGHGDSHDHDHDHHHHDQAAEDLKDLPPAEMLKLQQALLDEVQKLLHESRQLAAKDAQSSSLAQ